MMIRLFGVARKPAVHPAVIFVTISLGVARRMSVILSAYRARIRCAATRVRCHSEVAAATEESLLFP